MRRAKNRRLSTFEHWVFNSLRNFLGDTHRSTMAFSDIFGHKRGLFIYENKKAELFEIFWPDDAVDCPCTGIFYVGIHAQVSAALLAGIGLDILIIAQIFEHRAILAYAIAIVVALGFEASDAAFGLEKGDKILMCSDGLTNMLTKEQIEKVLNEEGLKIEEKLIKVIKKRT